MIKIIEREEEMRNKIEMLGAAKISYSKVQISGNCE